MQFLPLVLFSTDYHFAVVVGKSYSTKSDSTLVWSTSFLAAPTLGRGRNSIHDQEHLACHAYKHDDRLFHRLYPDAASVSTTSTHSGFLPSFLLSMAPAGSRHSHRRCYGGILFVAWAYEYRKNASRCRGLSVTLSTLGLRLKVLPRIYVPVWYRLR